MCNTTKNNYSVQATSTITGLTPLNNALPIAPVELHKTGAIGSVVFIGIKIVVVDVA